MKNAAEQGVRMIEDDRKAASEAEAKRLDHVERTWAVNQGKACPDCFQYEPFQSGG